MRERVLARIDRLVEEIKAVDWEDKRIYAAYMAQTHYYVRHSTRLLAIAGGLMPMDQEVAHQRFMKHVGEENHHEKLASHDVKACGFALDEFAETSAVRAFYQVQYYAIEHVSPYALLGYILALECLAVKGGGILMERAKKAHGVKAVTFLKVHAEEDIDHVEKAFQMIESLPSNELRIVEENLELSCHLYEVLLKELPNCAYAKGKGRQAA